MTNKCQAAAMARKTREAPKLSHENPRAAIIALKMDTALDTLKDEDVPPRMLEQARRLEKAINIRKKHQLN
ncbi:hypothetical protein [Mesorhizobium sp. B2-3-5]|uniref:hypothetical protein n=1 Tax=Mesorhizobium sp. B2-3-5 TaxID=2589958 RepID=UPI00112753D0|nr:hypothetical protein [Mesorhizobium sp. B2-3-5]TPM22796.1 hypothetical protein FJ958_24475 [Mesorhizobium sp. B2-3-5]